MTLAIEPTKENFRLGMLVYDTRYRSYTIQVIVLLLVLLFLLWLTNNTISNLADRGKDINFDFLSSRAGYDGMHLSLSCIRCGPCNIKNTSSNRTHIQRQ